MLEIAFSLISHCDGPDAPPFPPPTWFRTSLVLHTRTWIIWHEEERHSLRRPSWPGLATVLDHWREPKVKHQDLRAMACECKGCLVDGCRGSASRFCGWPLGKKKRAIMRCHWCTADKEKTADSEPGEVKHQDLRAMACECKGCLVDG